MTSSLETPVRKSPVRTGSIKTAQVVSEATLVDFDNDTLRNALIRSAGDKLSQVAESSVVSMTDQISTIRESISDFDSILSRMEMVQENVRQIDSNVSTVVEEAQGSSQELERVSDRMNVLETNITAIEGLVRSVNDIADQTHLLSLNATIEAARAGEAGRGFAVVANEVKELATTTKNANQEIQETLARISEAVMTLSVSVGKSVEKMEQSILAVEVARESASSIGTETARFGEQLQASLENFHKLDNSSTVVENEVQEINTLGKTFSYLLELMVMQGVFSNTVDPLERLLPLVESSDFRAVGRFSPGESEYVLREGDVLISATDTRGKITFANNSFYEVAEYEPGTLEGAPHNVIRHPDMPKTAFADMWSVIKSGNLWQGYVCNRSKNGRIYWVLANVFPCYEHGKIVGYISIRTKPDPNMVQKAIEAYRLVK